MNGLTGKRALITGGSRGIGAAVVRLFAEHGTHVAIGYRSRRADAEALVAEVTQRHSVRAVTHAADVSTASGADELVAKTFSELGGLDFFVANAGIWPSDDVALREMSDEQWRRTIAENVDSVFYTTRAALRCMSDDGRVVIVSSTAGQRGEAFHADYAASKGAAISFVKSLAPELGKRGITVNSVAPGWVDTEMCAEPFANGGRERIAAGIPIGRIATPRDIAGPIVFLCSDLARHITGEILNVNGGSVLAG
ncbi:MAG TPA: SDR family NAD(P)-dependent oxidoreductase [Gemmatimonadaceae bacterium]|jgi:3-oxoacyl-[acyl-carrier protein] reductase|nr:SDR family NAD(P)-dependent oxidoreductase [Gemmatimonadaceae bacterium]